MGFSLRPVAAPERGEAEPCRVGEKNCAGGGGRVERPLPEMRGAAEKCPQGAGQSSLRTAERMVASWSDPEAVASQEISRPSTRSRALTW